MKNKMFRSLTYVIFETMCTVSRWNWKRTEQMLCRCMWLEIHVFTLVWSWLWVDTFCQIDIWMRSICSEMRFIIFDFGLNQSSSDSAILSHFPFICALKFVCIMINTNYLIATCQKSGTLSLRSHDFIRNANVLLSKWINSMSLSNV